MARRAPARIAALGSTLLFAAACGTMDTGVTAAPQPPVVFGGDPGRPIVVEYVVECAGCTVEYATPTGMLTATASEESFRRRVRFGGGGATFVTRLRVTPAEDQYVQVAEIWVNGHVAKQGGRGWEQVARGQVVQLTATIRGEGRGGRYSSRGSSVRRDAGPAVLRASPRPPRSAP